MSYIGKQPTKAPLTSSDIEDGIITAAKIEDGAVVAAEIASNAVTTAKINADAVTAAKIADDVINSEHIVADSIDAEHYAAGSVDTTALGADAVTGAKIADDAINSEHYTDGSIDTAHLADGQVTTAKLSTAVFTGATDIGADIADADLFLLDDGAGGTIRKSAASRIKAYVGGGLVLLSSVTISGSGVYSINNVFSSTYRDYKIIGSGLDQATNNSKWLFFLSTSSGNDTDNHYWHGTGGYGESANVYDVGGEDVTDFSIIDATSNDNNGSTNFELTLYRPQLAYYTAYTCIAGGRRHDGTGHIQSSAGYQNSNNQHVGIGFNVNQGNMSSGTIKIFGIKDSN